MLTILICEFWINLAMELSLKHTICVKYLTGLILGSFGNGQLIKQITSVSYFISLILGSISNLAVI